MYSLSAQHINMYLHYIQCIYLTMRLLFVNVLNLGKKKIFMDICVILWIFKWFKIV